VYLAVGRQRIEMGVASFVRVMRVRRTIESIKEGGTTGCGKAVSNCLALEYLAGTERRILPRLG
jgi:hypothetical protein